MMPFRHPWVQMPSGAGADDAYFDRRAGFLNGVTGSRARAGGALSAVDQIMG